jgi:uncharacterized protein (TIGR03083 family)
VNKFIAGALSRRIARAASAAVLSSVPGAHRTIGFVRPPAGDAFGAFIDALAAVPPHAATKCEGWTVHELTAHLAAGSAEIADLVELELRGGPSRPTRAFDEREEPYRALPPGRLRRAFFEQSLRATVAIERLVNAGGGRRVAFTGVDLDAQTLVLHVESELVLHRWDLVGEDAVSIAALGNPRFAVHAATTVAAATPNVFPRRGGELGTVILRSVGGPDIAVTGGPTTTIGLAVDTDSGSVVTCHPAVRTLMLWGRTPGPALPAPTGAPDAVAAVVEMLRPAPRDEPIRTVSQPSP